MKHQRADVALAVKRLQHRHHRALNHALAPLGLSLVQWDTLRHLNRQPDASLHDLAVLTFQTDQSFGSLAVRMADRGLIERITGPGRAVRHRLTQEGERLRVAGQQAEDEPLGTAGAIAALDDLEGTFLALNGDILTTLDFRDLVARHRESGCLATVAVKERSVHVDYGVVHADDRGRLVALEEKPQLTYSVSMGVYAFDSEIRERYMSRGSRLDFPDLLLRMVDGGDEVNTYRFGGYWRDIGNRDDYDAANVEFADDPGRFIRA